MSLSLKGGVLDEVFKDILWCIAFFFLAFVPAYIFEQRIKYQPAVPAVPVETAAPGAPKISAPRTDQFEKNCVICFSPTNSRCSGCKEVNYCSRQCQIIHWNQGHNKKCHTLNSSGVAAAGLTPQQMHYFHGSKSPQNVKLNGTSDEHPSSQNNKRFDIEKGKISRSQEAKFRIEDGTKADSSPVPKEVAPSN